MGGFPAGSPPAGTEVHAPHAAATREETEAEEPALCPQHYAQAPACTHSCDADGVELGQDRKDQGDRQALTNQNEDADQQRDEGTGAQRGRHNIGCAVAGLDGPVAVAAADTDGQSPCAAQGWGAAVHH